MHVFSAKHRNRNCLSPGRSFCGFTPSLHTATSDSGFWAAMLIGFYTFFRKSNLVAKSGKDFDPVKTLSRGDIHPSLGSGYLCAVVKNNSVSRTPIAYSGNTVINGSPSMPCASL